MQLNWQQTFLAPSPGHCPWTLLELKIVSELSQSLLAPMADPLFDMNSHPRGRDRTTVLRFPRLVWWAPGVGPMPIPSSISVQRGRHTTLRYIGEIPSDIDMVNDRSTKYSIDSFCSFSVNNFFCGI